MYCSLPTFQGFLTFFTQTNFTFLHFVAKPLKLQELVLYTVRPNRWRTSKMVAVNLIADFVSLYPIDKYYVCQSNHKIRNFEIFAIFSNVSPNFSLFRNVISKIYFWHRKSTSRPKNSAIRHQDHQNRIRNGKVRGWEKYAKSDEKGHFLLFLPFS